MMTTRLGWFLTDRFGLALCFSLVPFWALLTFLRTYTQISPLDGVRSVLYPLISSPFDVSAAPLSFLVSSSHPIARHISSFFLVVPSSGLSVSYHHPSARSRTLFISRRIPSYSFPSFLCMEHTTNTCLYLNPKIPFLTSISRL